MLSKRRITELKFVISERQSRQKELQELERKLTASQRDLREEELKMKHQVTHETRLNPRPPRWPSSMVAWDRGTYSFQPSL